MVSKETQIRKGCSSSLHVAIIIIFAISIFAANWILQPSPVLAYSCNLCHGVALWPGSVYGAQTEDEVDNLTCTPSACKPSPGYVPHIGNVLWLIDITHNGPNCQPQSACWVEAGYHTLTNSNGTSTSNIYYWGDNRPGNFNFHAWTFGNVQSGDLGNNVWLYIARNGNNSTWTVQVSPQTNYWSATSQNNLMYPDNIQMGMELLGSSGASANTGYFTYNYWQSTRDSSWHPQENSGSYFPPNSPVEAGWYQYPASNGSNNGGSFYTTCGC